MSKLTSTQARLEEMINEHLRAIAGEIGPRPVGSAENFATYQYLMNVLSSEGFKPQTFESVIEHPVATTWNCLVNSTAVDVLPGASTPALDVTDSPVMQTVYRTADDFVATPPSEGSIAVVALGAIHESRACELAPPAAAIAWFYEGHTGLYSGNCKRPDTNPLVAGFAIDEPTAIAWTSQPTLVTARIAVERQDVTLRSVVCDMTETSEPVPCLVAHYDSKPMAPGANDNASGVAVLLAMMQAWPEGKSARFILFDGEEIGVQGSTRYVEHLEEHGRLAEVSCVICPDSVGLGELHLYTADKYGAFPDEILQIARKSFADHDWAIPERAARSGGSDFWPFRLRQVPSLFLSDFPNNVRHTTADTLDHVDPTVLARLALVLADVASSDLLPIH